MKPEPLKNKGILIKKGTEFNAFGCEAFDLIMESKEDTKAYLDENIKSAVEWLKDRLGGECDEEVNEAFEDVTKEEKKDG